MLNCSHPQAKLSLVSLSLCLSHFLHRLTSNTTSAIRSYGSHDALTFHHWGGGGGGVTGVGGVCVKVPTWHLCLWLCVYFFCQFCIIKLDNCTVLMTSSNMLSINVTKSNLDIKCVHEWYTPSMLFHCLCVWTRVFFVCFACVCLKNIARWFNSWRLFLTAVNVKEARLYLFWLPTRCIL